MGKTPKLKTTLRKTPAKDTTAEPTSESSEAVSNNPWATETSVQRADSPSRQVSKTSFQPRTSNGGGKESDNASETSAATAATTLSHSQDLQAPVNGTGTGTVTTVGVDEPPKARRKKTITKITPHTFELADELKSQSQDTTKSPNQDLANSSQPQKSPATSSFSFSPLRTALDLPPIDPPPSSPTLALRSNTNSIPNNPFSPQRQHRKSSSTNAISTGGPALATSVTQSFRFIPASPPLEPTSLFNKVIVLTQGSSLISSSLIRQFHSAGARVIFGDLNIEKSRKLVSTLGPPDIVHYNRCDTAKYDDIVSLFKLAVNMYGRVDHAIFGVVDDGGAGSGVGEGEKLWGLQLGSKGRNKPSKEVLAEVEHEKDIEGVKMGDLVMAGARFAKIAMAYLQHTPKGPKGRRRSAQGSSFPSSFSTSTGTNNKTNATLTPSTEASTSDSPSIDRSLTFLISIASFKGIPHLTAYQVASHATLGVMRSLSKSVDIHRDGVRVNAVCTNMMIPTAKTMAGGRMSVNLPVGRVEDVSRVVAGVVGKGHDMHGRILYVTGEEAVDLEDGLQRNEKVWLGEKGTEVLRSAEEGWTGGGVEWMLMDALE